LARPEGVQTILNNLAPSLEPSVRVFLDSSGSGFGGFWVMSGPDQSVTTWHGHWPVHPSDSNVHELLHAAEVLHHFGDAWKGRKVAFIGDNVGALATLRKGAGHQRSPVALQAAHTIANVCALMQVTIVTTHIPGELLMLPDTLSRIPPGTSPASWLETNADLWSRSVASASEQSHCSAKTSDRIQRIEPITQTLWPSRTASPSPTR